MPEPRTESSRPALLRLTLDCELDAVRPTAVKARDFLEECGCSQDELMAAELALVEACNNAIGYADSAGRHRPVNVFVQCDPYQIELRVTDHTPGFDWPEELRLPDIESESGRGLYLISSVMDYARYYRSPGENVLVMRKNRSSPPHLFQSNKPETLDDFRQRLAENDLVIAQMVEELSSCYESLSAIFRYSTELGNPANLREFAQRLLSDLLQIVAADWFILRLVSKADSRLVVYCASSPELMLEPLVIPASVNGVDSVELEAAITHQEVWFDRHRPLRPTGPLYPVRPGAVGLAHPIFLGEDLIGTLTLGKDLSRITSSPAPGEIFTAAQSNVVSTFADFLAIQIVNARLHEQQVKSHLVAHELEIAKSIQQSLLLRNLPQVPGFDLAAYCASAHQVGGDFYDVLKISDHSLLLVVADVMGKGIPAAMFAAILRTLLRAAPELTHQPSSLLARVNRLLFKELSGVDMFITAQLAFVDSGERKLITASAGHCPLLVALPDGSGVRSFSPEGMPLGILPDTTFADEIVDLPPDSRALLYTDGLTEALNDRGERFGQDRLMRWLQQATAARRTAEELKEALAAELSRFQSNAALNDDQTFLIVAE